MVLIRLFSNNYSGDLLTAEAYESVAIQMSTGDHATHTTEVLIMPAELVFETYPVLHLEGGELVNIGADL